ncbi:hypothetical protein UCDDA912_g06602 [Diaporthe ampelina]|uniref:Uncharacterized protein n=1 Tax=Diaporthe ampelina TaxID=1214573 RepID=A0A0G2FH03_9PEZI|nr:hypothetical protein UCDDA912_g06602 [Diaporthe ampelina]
MASPSSPIRRRYIGLNKPHVNKLKRKAIADGPACVDSRPTKRHQTLDHSLIDGFAKLLSPFRLDDLPQEILLNILQDFAEPWVLTDDLADWEVYKLNRESRIRQQTLIALTKTCRRLNEPATSILYRCAHIPTPKSLLSFLSSLYIQPRLAELVKQVSCPQDVLMTVAYAFSPPTTDEGVPSTTGLIRHTSPRLGNSHPTGEPLQWYNSYCSVYVHHHVLYRVCKLIPGVRALSMTCDGPWHRAYQISPLPLERLAKLSIAMRFQPENYLRSPALDHGTLKWLNKSTLGQFPALQQLELVHPRGKWTAHLVTVEATTKSGSKGVEKYVGSLTTHKRHGGGFAVWELLSLERDIFSPAHLRALDYAGQSRRCSGTCSKVLESGWDLNRFLATTGRRIRTLNLDWEHDHTQLGQLGPAGLLTSLPVLTNLTHLTVSMQLLFRQQLTFYNQLQTISGDPEPELARLLPPSLRVLRISEFMLGVLRPADPGAEDRSITRYNGLLFAFIHALRAYWLDARDDRELWFRYCLRLERHPRMADERSRRILRGFVSPQRHQHVGKEFARVYRMLPRAAATIRERKEAG